MKLKIIEAIGLANAIGGVQAAKLSAHPRFGLALAINSKLLVGVGEAFEASRKELVDKHAEKGEDGKNIEVGEGNERGVKIANPEALNADMKALLEDEIDLALKTVKISQFPDEIDPGMIAGLMPIIEDDDGAEPAPPAPSPSPSPDGPMHRRPH